ncbi:MAG TPA: hypothetical protein VGM76_14155 [Lacipirellulaceae bacterium]|jgi:hypothetical protein
MKQVESPPVTIPMLRVNYAADIESRAEKQSRPPRIRRPRRKSSAPADDASADISQVRARLLKMIVQNERDRSHDHRAS